MMVGTVASHHVVHIIEFCGFMYLLHSVMRNRKMILQTLALLVDIDEHLGRLVEATRARIESVDEDTVDKKVDKK